MRVLLAQLTPAPADIAGNAARVENALAQHPEAELAVFPELFLSGYELPAAAELAVTAEDEVMRELRRAAARRRTAVVLGLIERTEDGTLANSAACIDSDGELAGVYRKTHLFGEAEQGAFAPGDELLVTEVAGRWVAPLICFDAEFPEPARAVAGAGAEVLVTIAANMEPYGPDHALAVRARALDNRRPHVYVNQAGRHRGLHFVGGSCAIDRDGGVLASAGDGERLLEIDLPVGPGGVPDEVDYLRHARPNLPVRAPIVTTAERGEGSA